MAASSRNPPRIDGSERLIHEHGPEAFRAGNPARVAAAEGHDRDRLVCGSLQLMQSLLRGLEIGGSSLEIISELVFLTHVRFLMRRR
jgi:hypothetical protein